MRDQMETENGNAGNQLWDNVRISLMFLTRLPLPDVRKHPDSLASVMSAFPVAGAIIGGLAGTICVFTLVLGLPVTIAAVVTVAAMALLTGALHEDGLADVADGFGGGQSPARKLDIMKDSRIGTYGVLALIFAVALKVSALSALLEANLGYFAIFALFAGLGAWSRSLCVTLMASTPNARGEGIAATAGLPSQDTNRQSLIVGGVLLGFFLWPVFGLWTTLAVFAVSCAAFWLVRRLALRQIGGHTGDVAGTVQIVAETAMLITLAAAAI